MFGEIYLDNSATTKPYDDVIEYIAEISKNFYGNPSSLHSMGIEAERKVNKAREAIAKSLGTMPKQVFFTSGGTESNNLAIKGYLEANPRKGKHIITTAIEHPSVIEVFKYLEKLGYKVDYIGVDSNGRILMNELKAKINTETALVSIMLVNNETGSIQPIKEASSIVKSINPQTIIHTDAVQAFGKITISPGKSGIDLMSVSSHKIHGPKGIGALYVSENVKLKPLFSGGGQESLLRSGTENVPGICGFGLAVENTYGMLDINFEYVEKLKNTFIEGLEKCTFDYRINSSKLSSPYILNISFEGLKSEVLLHHLEEGKIFVSAGSACSSRKRTRSHVLQAMCMPDPLIDSAIRFSFSSFNNEEEIKTTISALQEIVPKIQKSRRMK
jgi:Cysteine sulfinate desulfinase/cysteine desulfurase and related enzymes